VFFRLAIRPVARDASLEKIGTLAIPAH